MGKQYNKAEKRKRRDSQIKRKKAVVNGLKSKKPDRGYADTNERPSSRTAFFIIVHAGGSHDLGRPAAERARPRVQPSPNFKPLRQSF